MTDLTPNAIRTRMTAALEEPQEIAFVGPEAAKRFIWRCYGYRNGARKKSKFGRSPLDPVFDTSPWDGLTFKLQGNVAWVGVETERDLGVVG